MVGEWILFSSYGPGTGKTTKMLEYANGLYNIGFSIVIGTLNSQFRKYKTSIPYMGENMVGQFSVRLDVKKVIDSHPQYVVLDELAFWNELTKHRVYEDALLLKQNGISIISTANMQCFDEVWKRTFPITKIKIKMLIPDRVLEDCIDKVIWVDCDICDVISRYESGCLFPKQNKILNRYITKPILECYYEMGLNRLNVYSGQTERIR